MSTPIRVRGTISGWDGIRVGETTEDQARASGGRSLAELYVRLERLQTIADADVLHRIKNTILEHIQNESNPHHVTIDQLGIDVVDTFYQEWLAFGGTGTLAEFKAILFQDNQIATEQEAIQGDSDNLATVSIVTDYLSRHGTDPSSHQALLSTVMPGAAPVGLPSRVVRGDLDSGALHVSRPGPMCVIDRLGYVTTVEADRTTADYSYGVGMIPLWSERTNTIRYSNPVQSLTASYHGATQYTQSGRVPSLDRVAQPAILREDVTLSLHGFTEALSVVQGAVTVASAFVFPLITTGRIRIYVREHPDLSFWYDPKTRTVFSSNNQIIPHLAVLANGWCRLGLEFISPISGTLHLGIMVVSSVEHPETPYMGVDRDLFAVWGVNCTTGSGMAPYIPTNGTTASLKGTQATIQIPALPTIHGMLAFRYHITRQLMPTQTNILSIGSSIFLTERNGLMTAIIANDQASCALMAPAVKDQIQACAISYTRDAVSLCVSGYPRVSEPILHGYMPDDLDTVQLGPIDGYIQDIVFYPHSDTGATLEYLTGGL